MVADDGGDDCGVVTDNSDPCDAGNTPGPKYTPLDHIKYCSFFVIKLKVILFIFRDIT